MSGNSLKNQNPPTAEKPEAARVVAIPKEQPAPATGAPNRGKTEAPKTERIGDILRRARLDKNDDLYQIAEYLCIKPHFLIALENSHYDALPADAYVIGFLRTYANFLGVDGKIAVDRYRYEMAGRRKKPVLSMPTPVSEARAPTGIIMAGATIALLLIYALWYGISSSNRAQFSTAPPLPTVAQPAPNSSTSSGNDGAAGLTAPLSGSASVTTNAPADGILITKDAPKEQALPAALPPAIPLPVKETEKQTAQDLNLAALNKADTAKPAEAKTPTDPNGSRVTIRATQSSWIMITDNNGKAIYDHVLKPGESYKVPNKSGLSLTTGNGSGIVMSVDGKDVPPVANGAPHVVRNIDLTPDHLSATTTQ